MARYQSFGDKFRVIKIRDDLDLDAELVALVDRKMPDPGIEAGFEELTDEELDISAHQLLRQLDGDPLWLFAYGSLIWKPDFDHVEVLRCTAFGVRRAFCLSDSRWRANPAQPGLIMTLDRGGSCHGVAYRLPDRDHHAQLLRLLRREVAYRGELETTRWLNVWALGRRHRALTFWAAPRSSPDYLNLPIEEQARRLANAAGIFGSAAAYLHNTIVHLQEIGIYDSYLWRLQRLVAEEIKRLHPHSVVHVA